MKPEVIMEQYPYRFVQCGTLEINGSSDYRIQKFNDWTKRYTDMYLLDNSIQLDYCLEDPEYTKWLDPDRVPATFVIVLPLNYYVLLHLQALPERC